MGDVASFAEERSEGIATGNSADEMSWGLRLIASKVFQTRRAQIREINETVICG